MSSLQKAKRFVLAAVHLFTAIVLLKCKSKLYQNTTEITVCIITVINAVFGNSVDQGGYIFYAGASLAGVTCRRRRPRLLLLS